MKVVIAGGTSGIGLATAALLAKEGKDVIITGRNEQKLQQALATLPSCARGQVADSTDIDTLKKMMAATGHIDHLILSLSGAKGAGLFKDLDLVQLREGFEEKFFPQLQTVQVALPYLVAGGSITFISAVSGHARMPGIAGLAAINGALEAIVPILAKELQPIRVNAVSPGIIDTPWWDFIPADTRREIFRQHAQSTPAGRIGLPNDVARVIALLTGNTFITGQVITVDGGWGL